MYFQQHLTSASQLSALKEAHARRLDALLAEQECARRQLVVEHSARFAESEVGRMQARTETLQLQVQHYKDAADEVMQGTLFISECFFFTVEHILQVYFEISIIIIG